MLCVLCCGAGVVSYIVLYVMLRHYCNACVVLYVSYVLSCTVCIVGHGVAFIVRTVFFIALTAVLCFLERLKQKMAKLGLISKQLQGIARQLVNTQVPLPIQSSAEELCRPSFPQQRAAEMGEHTGALLAQDEQDDFSQRAAEELQAQVAADEESYQLVKSYRCSLRRRQTKTPNWMKKSLASMGRWVWQRGHLRRVAEE